MAAYKGEFDGDCGVKIAAEARSGVNLFGRKGAVMLDGDVVCLVELGRCGVAVELVGEGMVVDGEAKLWALMVAAGATEASGE